MNQWFGRRRWWWETLRNCDIQRGMQPLEAARRALQFTRIEDLAGSIPFLTANDDELLSAASDELLSAASGALLLFLWCMGLGGLRTLTSVGHLPFIDIGLCLLYFSHLPALTSLVLLFVAITYWQDAVDWPDQVAKGGVRTASFALYFVAVVAYMTWENRAALWESCWATVAIVVVIGIFVEWFKTGQPDDAYGGYDVCGGYTFYGTYNTPSTESWLLLHAMLRHAQSYFESGADLGLIDGTTRIGSVARNVAYYVLTTCIYGFSCFAHAHLISPRFTWVRTLGAMTYPILHRERY